MFQKMEITVVGKNQGVEGEEDKSEDEKDDESDCSDGELNQSYIEDNKISQKHQKFTDLETRA